MRERVSGEFGEPGVGKTGNDRGDSCDLVFRGGRIYTVDPQRPWAEALAIGGGRFLRVGGNGDVEESIGENTEVVDLEGRLVIPAIYDTHVHLITAVHFARSHCRLPEPSSNPGVDDYLSAIEKTHREGGGIEDGWFLGGVWSPFPFALEGPRREMLDEILGDVPAFLMDTTLHSAWVNSAALQIAGIDKNTPDPQFGMIVRDAKTGEPTGFLIEYSGMAMVGRHIPKLPIARRMELAERGVAELNSQGVVGFCEAASEEADLVALHRLARDGRLDARVLTRNLVVQAGSIEEDLPAAEEIVSLAAKYNAGRLDTFGAKVYVDGIFMNDTVAFLDRRIPFEMPYRYGDLTISPDRLKQVVSELDRHGLPIMMHCIGDKAVRVALDAVEVARTANGDSGLRHCITHGFTASLQDIPRYSQLGVALSLQTWASTNSDIGLVMTPRIGEERWEKAFPYKSLMDAGTCLSIGSDWPCITASCNPFPGLAMVSTRIDPVYPERGVFNERERLTIEELIAMLTMNGARLMGLEEISGSIEVDKSADLVVLDRNILECLPEELPETRVLLTLLEGSPVYHAEDSPMLRSAEGLKTPDMWR
jgi:predicted amidohydrolase YtcJ